MLPNEHRCPLGSTAGVNKMPAVLWLHNLSSPGTCRACLLPEDLCTFCFLWPRHRMLSSVCTGNASTPSFPSALLNPVVPFRCVHSLTLFSRPIMCSTSSGGTSSVRFTDVSPGEYGVWWSSNTFRMNGKMCSWGRQWLLIYNFLKGRVIAFK